MQISLSLCKIIEIVDNLKIYCVLILFILCYIKKIDLFTIVLYYGILLIVSLHLNIFIIKIFKRKKGGDWDWGLITGTGIKRFCKTSRTFERKANTIFNRFKRTFHTLQFYSHETVSKYFHIIILIFLLEGWNILRCKHTSFHEDTYLKLSKHCNLFWRLIFQLTVSWFFCHWFYRHDD